MIERSPVNRKYGSSCWETCISLLGYHDKITQTRASPVISGKQSTCNAGDQSSITGSAKLPGEKNGKPLEYSCLENPMDRLPKETGGPWGRKELNTTYQLNNKDA